MSSMQVSVLQHFKELVQRNYFNSEYSLIALFLALLALQKWLRRFLRRYRFRDHEPSSQKHYDYENIPGPSSFPIIGSLHHITDLRSIISMLFDYSKRFGPIVRFELFNERFVILNNAPMVQILLQSTETGHFAKSPFMYDMAFKKILGSGVITSAGEHWKSQRKLLSPAFSYKSFQNYTRLFIKYSKKLVHELEILFPIKNSKNKEPKQINSIVHLCGMQIIAEAVMGLDLCSGNDGFLFYDSVRRGKELFGLRLNKPLLLADFLWKLHPLSKQYDDAMETINTVSRKMITKHRIAREEAEKNFIKAANKDISSGRNMVEEMLRANMSETDIMYEVNTMIFAGFETTSAVTQYLIFLLALNPEHQAVCREEIDAILADPMKCPGGELTYDAINDMKYMERCVNETLRLFPPIFGFFRKLETPLKLSETLVIPKGVNIAIPPLTIHRNPEYYTDPEKFDPDRFLHENIRQRHPYAFISFSSGPRNCMGTKFAMMAIKSMGAHIIRNFEVFTTDDFNDVNLLPNIFLTPERDYNFILKRRANIPEQQSKQVL